MIIKTLLKIFLLVPSLLFAQTVIYRSIKPSGSALATGAGNNLIVSNDTCYFASALPNGVGVGMAMQYDDDNDGDIDVNDSILFFKKRVSSTVFLGQTAAGGTPVATAAADQDWSVFPTYTGMNDWENGNENSLIDADLRNFDTFTLNKNITAATGSNEQWNVAVYSGANSPSQIGWTTATVNYIRIYAPYLNTEVGESQKHEGIYSNQVARFESVGNINTTSGTNHLRIEDLIIYNTATGASAAHAIDFSSFAAGYDFRVTGCIIRGSNNATSNTSGVQIFTNTSTAGTVKVSNCVIYDFNSSNTISVAATSMRAAGGTMNVYDVSAFNCKQGFQRTNGTLNVNNSSMNTHGISGADGFTGTISGNYNISNLASDAPGANSKNSTVIAYVDSAAGNFSLKVTDTAAKDSGADFSGEANPMDIIKTNRPQGIAFDIGAFEVLTHVPRNRVIIIVSVEKFLILFAALGLAGMIFKRYTL